MDEASAAELDPGEQFEFASGYSWALHRAATRVIQSVAAGHDLAYAAQQIQLAYEAASERDPFEGQTPRFLPHHRPLSAEVVRARSTARWLGYRAGLEAVVNDLSPARLLT